MKEPFKILFAGDFLPKERVQGLIDSHDYSFLPQISSFGKIDYSILNLECPIISSDSKPIPKCGPNHGTSSNAVCAIKSAGFNCVTLANNHFRDFGDTGCINTLDEIKKEQLDSVGGGINIVDSQKILYKSINGNKVAIVNFCENEFSIADNSHAGSAPLDFIDNYFQITDAKKNADYVIVIVHGGHEMYQLPSPRMKKLYHFFVTIGADAVINHHQHCYSGYEFYNGKPIVYGLGNYCFDSKACKNNSLWHLGYIVVVSFNGDKIDIELKPYEQCDETPSVKMLDNTKPFFDSIENLNRIIEDDNLLEEHFKQWVEKRKDVTMSIFASYHNRYLNAAANRKLIPRILKKTEAAAMLNFIECEAHRDVTIKLLENLM